MLSATSEDSIISTVDQDSAVRVRYPLPMNNANKPLVYNIIHLLNEVLRKYSQSTAYKVQ